MQPLYQKAFETCISFRMQSIDLLRFRGVSPFQVAEKPAAAPAPKSSQFPPAMRAYVERAFRAAKTPEQKQAMAPALKAVVDAASAKGELWMTQWDTLPLPSMGGIGGAAAAAACAVSSLQSGAFCKVNLDVCSASHAVCRLLPCRSMTRGWCWYISSIQACSTIDTIW